MIGQPAANAGPTLRVIMAAGKFHGVIAAHTPIGSLVTTMRLSPAGVGIVSPFTRLPSSANHSRNDAAYWISPLASASGLPCSVVRIFARSSAFSIIRSCHLRRITARCFAVVARHAGQAALAVSIARRVSAVPMRGTVAMVSPVAGFFTSKVAPSSAPCHSPAIYAWVLRSVGSFNVNVFMSLVLMPRPRRCP